MYARLLAQSLWESVISHLVGFIVITNQRGATLRRWSLISVGGFFWAILAYSLHPYMPNSEPMRSLLEYPFRALFAPDVFKHVLIGAFVFWFAYRAAAIYLDDIFELKNVRIAERFVRQSAFASQYGVIEIKDGEVALKDQKSPIFLIGGPGLVRVYLENAALFEKVGGVPNVIEPTTSGGKQSKKREQKRRLLGNAMWRDLPNPLLRMQRSGAPPVGDGVRVLEGFERLRQVIDLRDQVIEIDVVGRTREGIPIQAQNLRVIFSILRDGQESSLEKPYPFDRKAIETLTYGLTRESWTDAMAAEIKREIGKFIARHTLSEFLAAIGSPELEQGMELEAELQSDADRMAGLNGSFEIDVPDPPPFVPRPEISDLFYDYNNFVARVREKGVELRWIGVGTWVLPAEIIPERHLQAWRITYENLARGNTAALETLYESNRTEQLLVITRDIPISIYTKFDSTDTSDRKKNMVTLVNGYRFTMYSALDLYERRGEANSQQARKVREVWTHLAHVVGRYLDDLEESYEVTVARIELDYDTSKFDAFHKHILENDILFTISNLTNIAIDELSIIYIIYGSVIVTIEMPKEAAQTLLEVYKNDDPALREWKINNIDFVEGFDTIFLNSPHVNFLNGLKKLSELVEKSSSDVQMSFKALNERFLENLKHEDLYGRSEDNLHERNRIIWSLENFVKDTGFRISFVDLCTR